MSRHNLRHNQNLVLWIISQESEPALLRLQPVVRKFRTPSRANADSGKDAAFVSFVSRVATKIRLVSQARRSPSLGRNGSGGFRLRQ